MRITAMARQNYWKVLAIILSGFLYANIGVAQEADCYDEKEDYYIPATDLLEAKKKSLLCFFASITVSSSTREGNRDVKFEQETNLQAKSSQVDWSGLKKVRNGLYRWAAADVNANIKRLHDLSNEKRTILVEKEMQETWEPDAIKKEIVEIDSIPSGSSVALNGIENFCTTPCSKEVLVGKHTVVLWKQDYGRLTAPLDVGTGTTKFEFKLKTNVGRIAINDCPSGTSVLLDGNSMGTLNPNGIKVAPGNYIVTLEHPEFFKNSSKISVKIGETTEMDCGLKAKEGAISVSARDSKGSPIKAQVFLDGERVGTTPIVFKARIGPRLIRVVNNEEAWEDKIDVGKKQTSEVSASLSPIETEAEKDARRMLRPLIFGLDLGVAGGARATDRKTGASLKQPESSNSNSGSSGSDSQDTSLGFQANLIWKFSEYFGVHAAYAKSDFRVQGIRKTVNSIYGAKYDLMDISVGLDTLSLGVRYFPIFGAGSQLISGASAVGWFDMGLSYLVHSSLTVRNSLDNENWSQTSSGGKVFYDVTLLSYIHSKVYVRLLNVAFLPKIETPSGSTLSDIGGVYLFNIVGIGYRF